MATTTAGPTTFLSLALEIRDMIYELALLWNREIIPYPAEWERDEAKDNGHPSIALTMVNKQIAQEARAVLYGKNTWRLPANLLESDKTTIFMLHSNMFRRVNVNFDIRDLPESSKISTAKNVHLLPKSTLAVKAGHAERRLAVKVEHAERRFQIHAKLLSDIMAVWNDKLEFLKTMQSLKGVLFDLENAMCPGACCRHDVLTRLSFWFELVRKIPPLHKASGHRREALVVDVIGFWSAEEQEIVHSVWNYPGHVYDAPDDAPGQY